jgi:hypothetical protein
MDERAQRVGRNEALYREVNEEMHGLNERFSARAAELSILCECGSLDCKAKLDVPVGQYEAVRSDPTRFMVCPDHVAPDVEDLVERHDEYWVVAKHEGEPAELARRTDTRS